MAEPQNYYKTRDSESIGDLFDDPLEADEVRKAFKSQQKRIIESVEKIRSSKACKLMPCPEKWRAECKQDMEKPDGEAHFALDMIGRRAKGWQKDEVKQLTAKIQETRFEVKVLSPSRIEPEEPKVYVAQFFAQNVNYLHLRPPGCAESPLPLFRKLTTRNMKGSKRVLIDDKNDEFYNLKYISRHGLFISNIRQPLEQYPQLTVDNLEINQTVFLQSPEKEWHRALVFQGIEGVANSNPESSKRSFLTLFKLLSDIADLEDQETKGTQAIIKSIKHRKPVIQVQSQEAKVKDTSMFRLKQHADLVWIKVLSSEQGPDQLRFEAYFID